MAFDFQNGIQLKKERHQIDDLKLVEILKQVRAPVSPLQEGSSTPNM